MKLKDCCQILSRSEALASLLASQKPRVGFYEVKLTGKFTK